MRWFAVRTHAHSEGKAKNHLEREGFAVYLPRHRKRRRHARRTEIVKCALFPRYLFVKMDIETARWRAINSTVGVSNLVSFGGKPASVPTLLIEEIQSMEDEDDVVVLANWNPFRKGQSIRILSGAFSNQTGLFECIDDNQRVIVLLDLLGRSMRVPLPMEVVATTA